MSYIPSEDDLNVYENKNPSLAEKYKDYLQGYGSQLLQSGAKGGYHLGMLPSYGYEAIAGHPLYSLIKPDVTGFIPESEAGQTGKHVGETVSDLASLMIPGKMANKALRAAVKFHPFTEGQMGRGIQRPIAAAEKAGIRAPLSNRELFELNEYLSHQALQNVARTGKELTPAGIEAILQGSAKGTPATLHSAQSLLNNLSNAISKTGENIYATTRVKPMQELILNKLQQGMKEGGIPEEAENLQQGRTAAARYYKTQGKLKKVGKIIGKPLSIAAIIKGLMTGARSLP